jgi:hypothetical protein
MGNGLKQAQSSLLMKAVPNKDKLKDNKKTGLSESVNSGN